MIVEEQTGIVRERLHEFVAEVALRRSRVAITRFGRVEALLVAYEELRALGDGWQVGAIEEPVSRLKQRFAERLAEVAVHGARVVITRSRRPLALLIGPDELDALENRGGGVATSSTAPEAAAQHAAGCQPEDAVEVQDSVNGVRDHFNRYLSAVAVRRERVIITRHGRPEAALIALEDLRDLEARVVAHAGP